MSPDEIENNQPATFVDDVIEEILQLEPGEIVTYGEIARRVGAPGTARAVGSILSNHGDEGLPWWRVVAANGRLVPGHELAHERHLQAEGVAVVRGRIPLDRIIRPQ